MTSRMPRYGQAFLLPSGAIAPVWYDYLRTLDSSSLTAEIERQVQANAAAIKALQEAGFGDYLPASAFVLGINSVETFGELKDGARVMLRGDVALPDPTTYYGANSDQDRGFHPISDAIEAAAGELTKDVDEDGVTTFGLEDVTPAVGGTLQRYGFDDKGRRTHEEAADTDDLAEGATNLYFTDERADARINAQKGQPGGLATLDANAKLDAGQLPALAITETFVVNSEAAMLDLDVQQGDVAVRSDLQASFILTAEPASTLSNWQELLTPTGGVSSFNGRTGSVVPASGDYTAAQVGADPAGSAASAQAFSIQRGNHTGTQTASTISDFAATVRATVLTGLSTATNAAITAADSVLSALGKLQAQITGLASTVSGLITQTITNGDTTHAPSGDAVFDALAGKLSADGSVIATGNLLNSISDFRIGPNTADGADTSRTAIMGGGLTNQGRGGYVVVFGNEHPTQPGNVHITAGAAGDVFLLGGAIRPQNDGAIPIGIAAARYSEIFAVNGAINTSDAREKTEPRDLTAAELSCASDLARLPSIFQWLAAIEEKGADARLHCSPTVQSVIAIMEAHGLDPFRYGFVCYDEWDETPEVRDEETGEVSQEYRPAGDRYSLRPNELAHFVLRGLAHRQDELERRLAALESE